MYIGSFYVCFYICILDEADCLCLFHTNVSAEVHPCTLISKAINLISKAIKPSSPGY